MSKLILIVFMISSAFLISISATASDKLKIYANQCLIHYQAPKEEKNVGTENLVLKTGDCDSPTETYKLLDEVDTPEDTPTLDWVLPKIINHKQYLIVMTSGAGDFRDERRYINYTRCYLPMIYLCEKEKCHQERKELDNFVFVGGDLKDFNTNRYLETYSYKSKAILEKDLNSKWFQDWINHKTIKGYITKNAELKADEYIFAKTKQRLNKNLTFTLLDITARKLKISFIDKKGNKIQGWIKCEDTNLCQDNL